jgi:hypothetical protein
LLTSAVDRGERGEAAGRVAQARLPQLDLKIRSRAVIQTLDQSHGRKLGAYCVCQCWLEVFSCRLVDDSDRPSVLAIILDFRKISVRSFDTVALGGEISFAISVQNPFDYR